MDKDRIAGTGKQAKGAMKDAAGKAMGDRKMQAEGKMDKAEGRVQKAVGKGKDAIRDATRR
ncbi:CsbD family protein [Inquilinus limosus]|uniref:CsbD family protein n=1 Tax=Inquilinus limosus TaxID=171674 RepID=UPI003F159AB9